MPVEVLTRETELIAAEAALLRQSASAVPGVYQCIVAVGAELAREGIAKDSRNVQQGYAFRGIDAVMNALAPLLAKHRLVILPRMISRDVVERQTKTGGILFNVTVEMEFDFVCAVDGSRHTVRMFGEAMDSADKATNKSASAAYKYAAFQTFCIPTEGEDADETTPEVLATPSQSVTVAAGSLPSAPNGGDSGTSRPPFQPVAEPPVGDRGSLIQKVETATIPSGKRKGEPKWFVHFEDGVKAGTINRALAEKAQHFFEGGIRVTPHIKRTDWGNDLLDVGETVPF